MNVERRSARITKKVKIVLIGNPCRSSKHPLRMAEELAEIDLISRGRLVTGWVRGAAVSSFSIMPTLPITVSLQRSSRLFIVKAWTKPGPWRYEGKHFHYRHVNPGRCRIRNHPRRFDSRRA